MLAVLIHIYYRDSWEKIFRSQLTELSAYESVIMVNLCMDMPDTEKVVADIKKDFPRAYILVTPNIGKDIGGKLALIDLFLKTKQQAEYVIFLHDKISPHAITGERWRNKLFSVIQPDVVPSVIKTFSNNSKTGIVCAKDFIANEYDEKKKLMLTTNKDKLKELIEMYDLKLSSYTFVAGTMFWIRGSIIRSFFSIHSPLACREMLEPGDSTDQYVGTYTHSWERVFCWLANSQGYSIKGI